MNKTLSTVYKRELKICFSSLAGWLFIALNVAALGICAVWLGLKNLNPGFQYATETASIILCLTAPLLCAMTVSGEAKRGEASMLLRYASPVSLACGKYLAHLTLFAIPAVIAALLPLALIPFGITHFAAPYMGVISYVLVGAALMAISFFIAVLIKHSYVSFVVSVAVLLLLNVASNVAKVVGSGSTAPFVVSAVVIIALITAIMLVYMKDVVVPAVFAAVALVGVLVLFLSGSVASVMRAALSFISPQYAFYDTIYGTVSVQGIVQPVLFAVAFLVFSALAYANYGKELTLKLREEEARR